MPIAQELLDEIALTRGEYDLITEKLQREPTAVELGMFGALWSEHCGYKHSRPLLRLFPTEGDAVRVSLGEGNAGALDVGNGLTVVFKVESHNHPSAVEPFQGAATGVGGIIRDVLAMGARPIALLNSLRFGPLDEARNARLLEGVVAGISAYGNCVGIPNVGGEVAFDPSYSDNPLVNVLCVGLIPKGSPVRAAAENPGDTLMLVGALTGRDGIHGASGLASRTFSDQREMRPTVQVGDPFLQKVLIEACLDAARSGHLEGMQDLGAAGLTSSAVEVAARGGTGVELDVAPVPRRERGMTAYEVMLSESQERMLLIVRRGREEEIERLFEKWDLEAVSVGRVTGDGIARVYEGRELVAEAPVKVLTDAPEYRTPGRRPAYLKRLHSAPLPSPPQLAEAGEVLKRLLGAPAIASKHGIYRRYDHEVQTNTVVKPGRADAAVLRIRGGELGLALSLDGNGRMCYLEPFVGGALAVAEACRNVAATGARPVAVTDCLNFGSPENPEVYYQMEQAVAGMAHACRILGVPVVSGNVSLYNESRYSAIYPTPIVGALGILKDVQRHLTMSFRRPGDAVVLLGAVPGGARVLAGSEYLAVVHGLVVGQPQVDLDLEARVQRLVVGLAVDGLLHSAHDCSEGGLAVALAESCILGGYGSTLEVPVELLEPDRWDAGLFGEAPSRVVVSTSSEAVPAVLLRARQAEVPAIRLGTVGGKSLVLRGFLDEPVASLAEAYGALGATGGRP